MLVDIRQKQYTNSLVITTLGCGKKVLTKFHVKLFKGNQLLIQHEAKCMLVKEF